jgi:predicted ATPase
VNVDRFVVISGCSGGGKSTLLAELERRGHSVVEEPGRRIVVAELETGGFALPWVDEAAFARKAIDMAMKDRTLAERAKGKVFFDRGLIDAAAALQHMTGEPTLEPLKTRHRYNRCVFLTPPWPEIYVRDQERRHAFDVALAEYARLLEVYPPLGYELRIVPKRAVAVRADYVLKVLG